MCFLEIPPNSRKPDRFLTLAATALCFRAVDFHLSANKPFSGLSSRAGADRCFRNRLSEHDLFPGTTITRPGTVPTGGTIQ